MYTYIHECMYALSDYNKSKLYTLLTEAFFYISTLCLVLCTILD